jgi:tellurite resistance protein TehA-like permease
LTLITGYGRFRVTIAVKKMSHPQISLTALLLEAAETLFPGYFALVMATGVVSIALFLLGYPPLAHILVWLNWVFYACLWGLTAIRLARFRALLLEDLFNHQRAPGFFTIVAATCVLGTQNMVVNGAAAVALTLWWIGLGLWFLIMYAFFTAVTVRTRKPSLGDGINGAWLIAAVATHSIVVLRGAIDVHGAPPPALQFLSLAMFMIGCMLYLAIIPLIFYRLTFIRMESRDFSPPYWINMGAVAIATLAGSTLILRSPQWPLLQGFDAFLRGFTLFFWAAATWWIPFLAALMVWRYLVCRDPVRYEPALWGMVFPLGMYTTGTFHLSRALNVPFLLRIADVFILIAALAWLATFIGLLAHLARAVAPRPASSTPHVEGGPSR